MQWTNMKKKAPIGYWQYEDVLNAIPVQLAVEEKLDDFFSQINCEILAVYDMKEKIFRYYDDSYETVGELDPVKGKVLVWKDLPEPDDEAAFWQSIDKPPIFGNIVQVVYESYLDGKDCSDGFAYYKQDEDKWHWFVNNNNRHPTIEVPLKKWRNLDYFHITSC